MTQGTKIREVLVVEDEPLLRWQAMDMVESAGCVALEAATAQEALGILAQHPAVEVLFTDINMPGSLDGLELAWRVHDRYPRIKLILTSGKSAPPADEIPDDGIFFSKPYSQDEVARQLAA